MYLFTLAPTSVEPCASVIYNLAGRAFLETFQKPENGVDSSGV